MDQPGAPTLTEHLPPIAEWRGVDAAVFREQIVPANKPAVLRGLAQSWPAVRTGSAQGMADYLRRFDAGRPTAMLVGEPAIGGKFFYRDDMRGLNFQRQKLGFADAVTRILSHANDSDPPAVYIESAPVPEYLPGFERENALDLLPASVSPRIWIGNAIKVQTHFDLNDNIAVVAAGRRRFTLFPPDQLRNLYVGPFDFTLSGPPVSMAPLDPPDLARYPRFAEALEHAQSAVLEPGDAIYIPYFWWHHVQSLERFNVLVNYWWNEARPIASSPFDCLLHALLVLRDLPPNQREAWRAVFEHYIFQTDGEPMAHLAPEHRGMLGATLTPQAVAEIKSVLMRGLNR